MNQQNQNANGGWLQTRRTADKRRPIERGDTTHIGLSWTLDDVWRLYFNNIILVDSNLIIHIFESM